jgi:hypothetical protein
VILADILFDKNILDSGLPSLETPKPVPRPAWTLLPNPDTRAITLTHVFSVIKIYNSLLKKAISPTHDQSFSFDGVFRVLLHQCNSFYSCKRIQIQSLITQEGKKPPQIDPETVSRLFDKNYRSFRELL